MLRGDLPRVSSGGVCRPRASRALGPGGKPSVLPPTTGRDAGPDIILDYEESLRPELIVHTDVDDPLTAAQKILFLVQGLAPIARDRAQNTVNHT